MNLGLGLKSRWEAFTDIRRGVHSAFIGEVDFDRVCFGFFGEFGYGVIGWIPYLKYLSEQLQIRIVTAGLPGSTPFYTFSSQHFELDIKAHDGWGSISSVRAAKLKLPSKLTLFAPTNDGRRQFQVNGVEWLTNEIHCEIDSRHYSRLDLDGGPHARLFENVRYVVVNIKSHYNWGNTSIPNYYKSEDIEAIVCWARKAGIYVLINRFPSPLEDSNNYFDVDLAGLVNGNSVIDLAPYYASLTTLSDRNRMQIAFLKGAERVFAAQGGNAALALIANKSVSVLMRGGFDFPDYVSLARIYSADLEFLYSASQSKHLQY